MDGQPTWTDCNVLSPRDLVSRPDIMDETVPHTTVLPSFYYIFVTKKYFCNVCINTEYVNGKH